MTDLEKTGTIPVDGWAVALPSHPFDEQPPEEVLFWCREVACALKGYLALWGPEETAARWRNLFKGPLARLIADTAYGG